MTGPLSRRAILAGTGKAALVAAVPAVMVTGAGAISARPTAVDATTQEVMALFQQLTPDTQKLCIDVMKLCVGKTLGPVDQVSP